MTNQLIQAYRQAPWRNQLQWIGLFLLVVLLLGSIASIYLNVSATAAATGREIQSFEWDSTELDRSIADLETQLAQLTSAAQMEERAAAMDFQPSDPAATLYLVIPDYGGRQPAVMAPAPGVSAPIAQPLIRPSYTQSMLEWLFQGFLHTPMGTSFETWQVQK